MAGLIKREEIDIVAPDGAVRCDVFGYYSGSQFIIDDMEADVRPGDEIRRMLPNGREEAFIVEDPKYYAAGPFGPHYQVKIGRRDVFPKGTGGHYMIHVSGPNSRVNVHSTDRSINTVVHGDQFNQLRKALDEGIKDDDERENLKKLVDRLEAARDQKSFTGAYQALIASAANHMTIIAPFLPALTELLKHVSS
ncbi:MAG: hypothetical protein ACLQJR_25615 [Stellaceae bacterium]